MNLHIIDFGSSSHESIDNLSDFFVGTAGYQAPEITKHITYDGIQADIYSLAVTIFVIVVANYPHETNWKDHFKNETTDLYFQKIDPRGKVTSEFKELVIRMFDEDGSKRPSLN